MLSGALLFVSTCNAQNILKNQSDLKIYSDYSENEIKVIREFMNYLDSKVEIFRYDSSSLNVFYRDTSSYSESDLEEILSQLLVPENLEHIKASLALLKSAKLFDDFWNIREVSFINIQKGTNDFDKTDGLELEINPNGKYYKIIEQIADENEIIYEYYELAFPMDWVTPGMVAILFKSDTRNINFQSDSMRLIWIVHYITLITRLENNLVEFLELK